MTRVADILLLDFIRLLVSISPLGFIPCLADITRVDFMQNVVSISGVGFIQ